MDSDNSDDPGRRESEQRLKNNPKMNSKYLDEVIAKTGMDYNEAVETIEREKKARDTIQDGTASMYAMDLHTETVDWYARRTHTMPYRPKPASDDTSKREEYLKAREEDKARVKGLLGAGKRVSEGDMSAVEANAMAEGEENARAKEIFGSGRKDSAAGPDKALKQVQKGVKKMTEGL